MKQNHKILSISGTLVVFLLIAWGKAYKLQITEGDKLFELSEKRILRSHTYAGLRGNIYDRHNNLLATTTQLDSIYAQPKHLENPKLAAIKLSQIFPKLKKQIYHKLSSNKSFVWISRRVSPNISRKIKNLKLSGIGVISENQRHYPNYSLASQLLGLVDIDDAGISGLEGKYNQKLSPKTYKSLIYSDAKGRQLRPHVTPKSSEIKGQDITLTINKNIQAATELALRNAIRKNQAKSGWAIVMDPHSGEILSMANWPSDNPNNPKSKYSGFRKNQILSTAFEPGSIFKIATFASALEHNKLDMKELIDCEMGKYKIDKFTVRDITKRKFLTPTDIFKYSSNIGTLKIAERIGKENFYSSINLYGFGQASSLNLKEESKGQIPKLKNIGPVEFATLSYGYGLKTTTLQLMRFVSAIANGGYLIDPQIILENKNKNKNKNLKNKNNQILKPKNTKILKNLLASVTGESGTAKLAQIKNIKTAGKTGTTEKFDLKLKKYNSKKNYASFIGFAPTDNPKYIAMVVIDEPQKQTFGGQVAAPAWQEIMTYALAN